MIASVIAHLNLNESTIENALESIGQRSCVEMGQLIDGRLLPMTIEAISGAELDETHRWLSDLPEVDFVDVVYVQFDEPTANPAPIPSTRIENT